MKGKINLSKCANADDLFAECKRVRDSISQETIDKAIKSFQARVWTCESLGGKSLNGHSDIVKEYEKKGLKCRPAVEAALKERATTEERFKNLSQDIQGLWGDSGEAPHSGPLTMIKSYMTQVNGLIRRLYANRLLDKESGRN
jgi:hypothetical protein